MPRLDPFERGDFEPDWERLTAAPRPVLGVGDNPGFNQEEVRMDPITPHLDHAERAERRRRLDGQIMASPMKTFRVMREVGREVFADGAISKKHKELTALTVAVANNCWE
jgi:alkylhydroperoxidase/carboxymuconolactone decarboxylase family protein YurZ